MKPSRRSLSALLIATTALIAPQALAQEAGAAVETAQQPGGSADEPQVEDSQTDTIVIRGNFIPEPLQETSEVAAFLTDVDLERQGDSNAADALTRVTGLSIAEGKFIYVRGLGERYSSAILNGSPLPSPEPLQRVVPLDLFPSSILSGVLVQKSYSPEFPGEFGGGVIELSTLNMPTEPFLEAGVGFSVNTETTFATGYTYDGSDGDPLGFDAGTRKVPNQLLETWAAGQRVDANLDLYPGLSNGLERQRIGQSFENAKLNLLQINTQIPANGSVDLSGGTFTDIGALRIGVIGVLGYANDWEIQDGVQQSGIIDGGKAIAQNSYDYTTTDNKVGWDGLFGTGLEWDDSKIDWTNLWIRRTTKQTNTRFGRDELNSLTARDDRTAWYERELFSTQLKGEHGLGEIGFGDLTLGWRAAYAETTRDAPYEKLIRYEFDETIDRFRHDTSRVKNSTSFSELTDTISSVGVDASYAIPMSGVRDMVVSVGADHFDNARSSATRLYRFEAQGLSQAVQQTRVDYLFADFNINPDRLVLGEFTGADGAAAYDAQLEVLSAFAKVDAEFIPYVRTSVGARWEKAIQSVTPRSLFVDEPAPSGAPSIKKDYILPAATVTWNFFEDMQLRLGASKTIGRPQFRELARQQYLDPDSDRLFIGNPYLMDTKLKNIDARYEWFFDSQQYFTLGAFYKDIERPIESIVNEQGATVAQSYVNAPKAVIFGAEVELKKLFEDPFPNAYWLAGKTLLVQGNYTYADSEVQVGSGDFLFAPNSLGIPEAASNFVIDGSRMQGQSEHVANLQLGWQDDVIGSQGTLIVTYVSERSSARGRAGEPDYIQEPGVIMDFVWRREFESAGRPFTFSFKASNLLDEEYFEYQRFGGGEIIINQYDLGRQFSFGLSTAF